MGVRSEETKTANENSDYSSNIDYSGELKPIGWGKFGNIYDQFKGKAKEALAFLRKGKSGYLKGVFHRDEIGDIDLVWGEAPANHSGKGLAHIYRKHVETLKDFKSIEEADAVIEDVVTSGVVKEGKDNTWNIEKGNYRVVVAKDVNGNWILTAFDFVTPKKEKRKDSVTIGTADQTAKAELARAVANNLSESKGSEKVAVKEESSAKSDVDSKKAKELAERNANFDKVVEAQGGLLQGMPKSWRFNMYQVVGNFLCRTMEVFIL